MGKWIWTGVGIVTALGVVGALTYRVARAAGRPDKPRYPTGPDPGPLRPTPTTGARGPLATRLSEFIEELDEDELTAARNSMPANWWSSILAATQAPDDEIFTATFGPIGSDLSTWTAEQRKQLQKDLVTSVGVFDAFELKKILQDAGVSV